MSLARAVYSEVLIFVGLLINTILMYRNHSQADLMLLDNPLSAVDWHTGINLINLLSTSSYTAVVRLNINI